MTFFLPPRAAEDSTFIISPEVDLVFLNKCRVIQWVDADTVEIHPLINPYGVNVRARLKDKWAPERNEAGHDLALKKAKALLGAGGENTRDYVIATNTRHERTQSRIEMRLDPA